MGSCRLLEAWKHNRGRQGRVVCPTCTTLRTLWGCDLDMDSRDDRYAPEVGESHAMQDVDARMRPEETWSAFQSRRVNTARRMFHRAGHKSLLTEALTRQFKLVKKYFWDYTRHEARSRRDSAESSTTHFEILLSRMEEQMKKQNEGMAEACRAAATAAAAAAAAVEHRRQAPVAPQLPPGLEAPSGWGPLASRLRRPPMQLSRSAPPKRFVKKDASTRTSRTT